MPAPKWPPTITLHRASGQAKVRYRGHDYYLGKHGSQEARVAYADLVARLAEASPPPVATPSGGTARRWTVAEAVALWFAERAPRYDPEGRHVEVIESACRPLLATCPRLHLDELTHEQLDRVREDMIRRKWCASHITASVARIRSLVRWWERRRMCPAGTLEALGLLEPLSPADARVRRAPKRKPCTWEELSAVAGQCGASVRGILLLMWWTGARTGEARCMKAGEVERAGDVWLFRPSRHKTMRFGHERIIPLGPQAREVLGTRLDDRAATDYVWPALHGGAALHGTHGPRCYGRESFGKAVRIARGKAGVPGFQPYCCRHAHKHRVACGLSLEHARASLGHSQITTTQGYAQARDLGLAIEVARQMG